MQPDIRLANLVSGQIPDIKKAGLSGRISGASLVRGHLPAIETVYGEK
jgi:hypothetical protein